MSQAKKQITELHKKYREERDVKKQIVVAATSAYQWWTVTIDEAVRILDEQQAALQEEIDFWINNKKKQEWYEISPYKFVRWIGRKLYRNAAIDRPYRVRWNEKTGMLSLFSDTILKWKIKVLLNGTQKYNVESLAVKLSIPVMRVRVLLEDIKKEAEKKPA